MAKQKIKHKIEKIFSRGLARLGLAWLDLVSRRGEREQGEMLAGPESAQSVSRSQNIAAGKYFLSVGNIFSAELTLKYFHPERERGRGPVMCT